MKNDQVRGFTLAELMVVVVILGVLATLALFSFRKHVAAARTAEATQFLGAVRAAQESYFQSFGQYCGTPQPALQPAAMPFETRESWDPPADSPWRALGVQSSGKVWFQYFLMAGTAAQGPPATAPFLPSEVTGRPWFWAAACSDFDGDGSGARCDGGLANDNPGGRVSFHELSSVRGAVVSHHEGE